MVYAYKKFTCKWIFSLQTAENSLYTECIMLIFIHEKSTKPTILCDILKLVETGNGISCTYGL